MIHLQTSFHLHYRIHHNNSVLKIMLLIVVSRRIRNHLQRPNQSFIRKNEIKEISSSYLMSSTNQIHIMSIQELKYLIQMNEFLSNRHTLATTSAPNVNETPRSFSPQPCVSLSGSDLFESIDQIVVQSSSHSP